MTTEVLTTEKKKEIVKISKQFAAGFKSLFGSINDAGWLIVDPLSGYLNSVGFNHQLDQLPAGEKHPQVLIMTFPDGSILIPTGRDLIAIYPQAKNWMWLNK